MSIVRFWCSRGFVSFFFLFHGWCPHFTLVISLYCFVHFSYSRESNERDGTVEQDAVWASYFLPWVGAGAGWLADLAQAFCPQWVLVGNTNGRIGWRAVVYPMPWTSLFVSF